MEGLVLVVELVLVGVLDLEAVAEEGPAKVGGIKYRVWLWRGSW